MDLPHLVYTVSGRILRSPALHYAVLGAALFVGVSLYGAPPPVTQLVIPATRVEAALEEFQRMSEHPLRPKEKQIVIESVVDQEVLYAYALRLGLDKEPVVERRLAQIATFVAENPHEAKSVKERADEAVLLGLSDGDVVVRRILIDGAKRLIRAAVLMREPPDSLLQAYLRDHVEEFRLPEELRLSHVLVDAHIHHEKMRKEAETLLINLRKNAVTPETAANYGDQGFIEANLPSLSKRELERLFGYRFVTQLAELRVGEWEGPVVSRYGLDLVYIHERVPGRVPTLDQARKDLSAKVRKKLADEWLALRMAQLRTEFAITVGDPGKEQSSL